MYQALLIRIGIGVAIVLLTLTLVRAGFYLYFSDTAPAPSSELLLHAYFVGMRFDLRLLMILALPLIILGIVNAVNPVANQTARILWAVFYLSVCIALALFCMVDFAHYAYLEKRLDASVLRFLEDLPTSLDMVIQTYPVVILVFAILLIAVAALRGMFRLIPAGLPLTAEPFRRKLLLLTGAILLSVAGIWGSATTYSLRWSDAFVSSHHLASQLGLNPVLHFFDTLKNRTQYYDENIIRSSYPLMAARFGVDRPDTSKLHFLRTEKYPGYARRPNIVIVILESFGWYKTGLSGNPHDPTPNFDRMAGQGISFTRFYAPHGGTARSVWALITGLPDIEINKSSSRNPLIVRQHTIINAFENYQKLYFIGGSASWANIRGLLATNIPDIRIFEQDDYDAPVMDVWGISDLHLLEQANAILSQPEQQPFIAIIQTSGNHRPYNIPEDNRGFKYIERDEAQLAKNGFRSLADYNAMRFMDHAIGFFINEAARSSYYKDTLFVFMADHGNMRRADHMPAYVAELGLTEFQSPLVFYAPGLSLEPRQIHRVASQLDVLPSIASFVSQSYINTTLGTDLFREYPENEAYAFTITFPGIPKIGLIGQDHYLTMLANGKNTRLHRLGEDGTAVRITGKSSAIKEHMSKLVRAYYETAGYMRMNNPPAFYP